MLDSELPKERSLQLISLGAPDFIFNEPAKLSALPLSIWIVSGSFLSQ
jgi:hypothetical protein